MSGNRLLSLSKVRIVILPLTPALLFCSVHLRTSYLTTLSLHPHLLSGDSGGTHLTAPWVSQEKAQCLTHAATIDIYLSHENRNLLSIFLKFAVLVKSQKCSYFTEITDH